MFSSKGLSRQNLLSFSRPCCIMVCFGWGPWATACSRFVGERWQKRPLQDGERSRIQEQCLSWSLGSSITGGGLLFQIAARRPDFYSLHCPVNKYGLLLGVGLTLGDATFSSQQLGWALPATTLSAAGTRASVLKGYRGSATHWLSQVLVLSGFWADQLCVTRRGPHRPPFSSVPLPPGEVAVCSF